MLPWLLENALVAAVLAGGLGLLQWRARLRPALAHALWLVVLARLVLPPVLHWPWSLPVALPTPTAAREPAASAAAEPVEVREWEWVPAEPGRHQTPDTRHENEASPGPGLVSPVSPPTSPRWDDAAAVALAFWLAGAAVVGLRQALQARRLARRVGSGVPAPEELLRQVAEVAGRIGVRAPRVRVLTGLPSPAVCGLGRPVLLWPDGLDRRLPEAGVRAVLAHELAHLRRRDHWVRWLELLAGVLHWWNPVFWLVRRRVRAQAELACDAWAVGLFPQARRAFAEALLFVCETTGPMRAAPVVGAGGDGRREFQRRLTMIMRGNTTGPLPRRALAVVGLLALLALPAWTLGQNPPRPAKPVAVPKPAEPEVDPTQPNLTWRYTVSVDPREQKILELEGKLNALLKELKELRGANPKDADPTAGKRWLYEIAQPKGDRVVELIWKEADEATAESQPINLVRVGYALPPGKAEALASFLRENVKADVLETKVEGGKLVVTTTPDRQQVIGQFVSLIQGKPMGKSEIRNWEWKEGKPKPPAK
jgi:beta-lactamase regulating signal transducer with metallopeptidase domain